MTATFDFSKGLFFSVAACVGIWYLLSGIHYVDQHLEIVWVDTSRPVAPANQPVQAAMAGVVPDAPKPEQAAGEQQPALTAGEKQVDADRRAYIEKYAPVAVAEMRKYGIPASITLAQGILESAAGTGKLCKNTNNHFGIKCFSRQCKKGHCKNFTDDSHKDFFRVYDNAWKSFRGHSEFLKTSKNYRRAFDCGGDYKCFAQALEDGGYATLKNEAGTKIYADVLIRIIKLYQLDQYDR